MAFIDDIKKAQGEIEKNLEEGQSPEVVTAFIQNAVPSIVKNFQDKLIAEINNNNYKKELFGGYCVTHKGPTFQIWKPKVAKNDTYAKTHCPMYHCYTHDDHSTYDDTIICKSKTEASVIFDALASEFNKQNIKFEIVEKRKGVLCFDWGTELSYRWNKD